MKVRIVVTGDKRTLKRLNRLGSSLRDFRKALNRVGEDLSSYYSNEAFNSKGGVYGKRWPALSTRYQSVKIGRYRGAPMLVATGAMRNSFSHEANEKAVRIGNDAPYFKYHQSTQPRTVMPRRQMIGVNDKVGRLVAARFREDIREKLRR